MDIPTWILVTSAIITAIATAVIAANAIVTHRAMQKSEQERGDLYRAIVISNLLCSPSGDNSRLYPKAKSQFQQDYSGKTQIFTPEGSE